MKVEDVRIGMKVVPHSKSVWFSLDESGHWIHATYIDQPYLYVCGVKHDVDAYGKCFILGVDLNKNSGDYFLASDFEPYVEPALINLYTYDYDLYIKTFREWQQNFDHNQKLHCANCKIPQIEQIIFNPPATIVKWQDGTKTIVKVSEGQTFDKETGVAACFMKKIFGNHSKFKREIEKKTAQIKK